MEITMGIQGVHQSCPCHCSLENLLLRLGGGDWNQQVDILLCLLEVTAWVYDTNGYGRGGGAAMQRWDESRHCPLVPSGAQNVNKNLFVGHQK